MGHIEREVPDRFEPSDMVPADTGSSGVEGRVAPEAVNTGRAGHVTIGDTGREPVLGTAKRGAAEQVFTLSTGRGDQPGPAGRPAEVPAMTEQRTPGVGDAVETAERAAGREASDTGVRVTDTTRDEDTSRAYGRFLDEPDEFTERFSAAVDREPNDVNTDLARRMTTKNLAGMLRDHIASGEYPTGEFIPLERDWYLFEEEDKRLDLAVNVPPLAQIDADLLLRRAGLAGMVELELEEPAKVVATSKSLKALGTRAETEPGQLATDEQMKDRGLLEGLRKVTGLKWREQPDDMPLAAGEVLGAAVVSANEAQKQLANDNTRLIGFVTRHMPSHYSYDETNSLGGLGLSIATHTYDWRIAQFEAYGMRIIHDTIIKFGRHPDMPRNAYEHRSAITEAMTILGSNADTAAIAELSKVSKSIVDSFLLYTRGIGATRSYDDLIEGDDERTVGGTIRDPKMDTEASAIDHLLSEQAAGLLSQLSEKERYVVIQCGMLGRKQEEVGLEIEHTQAYTSRILYRGLAKLRELMEADVKE